MNKEQLEVIKEKVSQGGLYISRVPKKTRIEFIELAREDFEGDYGFCLKFLLDFHSGLLSDPNRMLMEQMGLMAQEIESLKSVPQEQQKKKVIRSVGGTVITEKEE